MGREQKIAELHDANSGITDRARKAGGQARDKTV